MNEFEQCIDEWATRCREKDAQITSLQTALDAEREKVKGLEGQYQRAYGRAANVEQAVTELKTHLSQLQALVREVVNAGVAFEDGRIPYKEVQIDRDWFDRYRATLDATTPAKEERGCQICKGAKGVPGNEQIINGIVVCDYCHVAYIREEGGDGE